MYGYQNHAGSLALLLDGTASCQAIEPRHANIDQSKFRLQPTTKLQRLATVCGLTNQLKSALVGEHGMQASPGKLMIVSDDHSRRFIPSPVYCFIAHNTSSSFSQIC